jgi:ATP-dependent Clp endopeptidase proteolytic subunit ClpP
MHPQIHLLKNSSQYQFGAKLSIQEVLNPYPNEHAARLRDPGDFDPDSFRRTAGGTISGTTTVPSTSHIIWGKLKTANKPADNPIPQALRFLKKSWTAAEAKKWLTDNKVTYISFEPAKEEKENKTWFEIQNKTEDQADVFIYEEIGAWGVTAKNFVDAFRTIKAGRVNLHINSPGGSVSHGVAIHNFLNGSEKEIIVHIDGIAASIASVIAMAGDKIIMPDNALMMIHEVVVSTFGRADDHKKAAEVLEKINEQIADIYATKSGKDKKEVRQKMADETWFTGKEALEYGLVDETTESLKAVASLDLEKFQEYKNLGKLITFSSTLLNKNTQPAKEGQQMTLNELKTQYPELCDQLIEEGKTAGLAQGSKDGAEKERNRIAAIQAVKVDGADDMVAAAIADPNQTAETLAVAIIKKASEPGNKIKIGLALDAAEVAAAAAAIKQPAGATGGEEAKTKEEEKAAAKQMADSVNKGKPK